MEAWYLIYMHIYDWTKHVPIPLPLKHTDTYSTQKKKNYKQVLISIKNEGKRDSSYVCINIIYIYIPWQRQGDRSMAS